AIVTSPLLFLSRRRPPPSPLSPYTTLFRSPPFFTPAIPFAFRRGVAAVRIGRRRRVGRIYGYRPGESRRTVAKPGQSDAGRVSPDRKSTRLNSSHVKISYAVFCLKKKNTKH